MALEVKVPRTTLTDEAVELIEWYVSDEAQVEAGEPLCLVESSKASIEIVSEQSGFVKILAFAGQRVPIRLPLCAIYSSLNEMQSRKLELKPIVAQQRGIDATKKALELAQRLGLDLWQIGKRGVIRTKDVQGFYEAQQASLGVTANDSITQEERNTLEGCQASSPKADDSAQRRLLRIIRTVLEPPLHGTMWVASRVPILSQLIETLVRVYSMGRVGSALRYAYYRNKLRSIGQDVRIDTGALFVIPEAIAIGDNTHIDTNVKIAASNPEQPVRIGKGVHIGANAVILGSGGVTIGDYAAVAAGSCVFSARNLPEMPARPGQLISMSHAAPANNTYIVWDTVVIEEYAFIGLNAVILPGVTVGRGSVVNSGAVVAKDIPAYAIVGSAKSSIVGRRRVNASDDGDGPGMHTGTNRGNS